MKPNDFAWEIFPDRSTFGIRKTIRINDHKLHILFRSETEMGKIMPPFRHLEADGSTSRFSSLKIYVFQNDGSDKNFPVWERLNKSASPVKKLLMYNRDRLHILYNDESQVLTAIDTQKAEAYYYMPQMDRMPYYEKAAPMRMIFHHWALVNQMILIHGACISFGDKGLLLAGKGGTGKSTTAVSAALSGFDYIGDDYVLADPDKQTIHSLYSSSKIRWDATDILPVARDLTVNEKDEDDKGIFFLRDVKGSTLPPSVSLSAVILPQIGKVTSSKYTRTTITEGLMSLGSSTIFQMPGSGKETLTGISALLRGIPVYRMTLSRDTDEINSKLREMISEL